MVILGYSLSKVIWKQGFYLIIQMMNLWQNNQIEFYSSTNWKILGLELPLVDKVLFSTVCRYIAESAQYNLNENKSCLNTLCYPIQAQRNTTAGIEKGLTASLHVSVSVVGYSLT